MFAWNAQKAILNFDKYRVSFEEGTTVFRDPKALEWEDPNHSDVELRLKLLGISNDHRILMIIYTIRRAINGGKEIRIISARQASRKERKAYAG
jgi:uncharacterized protein